MKDVNLSGAGKVIHPITYIAGKTMVIQGETVRPGSYVVATRHWDEKLITKLLRTGHLKKVDVGISDLTKLVEIEESSSREGPLSNAKERTKSR